MREKTLDELRMGSVSKCTRLGKRCQLTRSVEWVPLVRDPVSLKSLTFTLQEITSAMFYGLTLYNHWDNRWYTTSLVKEADR